MDSILDSVKHQLSVGADYDVFDPTIIMHINTALFVLNQIGIGPSEGFAVSDDTQTWDQFTSDPQLEAIKSFVYIRVRLLFDPPQTAHLIAALERQGEEYLWRLSEFREGATWVSSP